LYISIVEKVTQHVMLSSAGLYGVQYQKQNECIDLYTDWTQFQRTGIWNWECAGRQHDGKSWSKGSESHLLLNIVIPILWDN
jgi:hypothetical protein